MGNYLGAIKRFPEIQDRYDCFYCVVDLHALTVPQDPQELRLRVTDTAAYMLAAGLDPAKMTLFLQSGVSAHAELGWIMECTATYGELSRMTQFKEKSEGRGFVSGGLFTYPALMAADILLYDTDYVPVGDDQKQHVELCRDVAERFNSRYGPTFKIPEPLIAESGARIKSLQDPYKKMSKSDQDPLGYISLKDTRDEILKKVRRAVTDSGTDVVFDPDNKPAIANLMTIYAHCAGMSLDEVEAAYSGKGYAVFKRDLAEIVIETVSPLQERYSQLCGSDAVERILLEGAEKAHKIASCTLKRAKERLGLLNLVDPIKG